MYEMCDYCVRVCLFLCDCCYFVLLSCMTFFSRSILVSIFALASASGPLNERFLKAAEYVKTKADRDASSYEAKLECYALFKQATVGDAIPSASTDSDAITKQKQEAWRSKAGMAKEEAMQAYVDLISDNFSTWEADQ